MHYGRLTHFIYASKIFRFAQSVWLNSNIRNSLRQLSSRIRRIFIVVSLLLPWPQQVVILQLLGTPTSNSSWACKPYSRRIMSRPNRRAGLLFNLNLLLFFLYTRLLIQMEHRTLRSSTASVRWTRLSPIRMRMEATWRKLPSVPPEATIQLVYSLLLYFHV